VWKPGVALLLLIEAAFANCSAPAADDSGKVLFSSD
jgi:hypothetical protein